MKSKEKSVKICPRCGSTNIIIPGAGLDIKMTFQDQCRICGYRDIRFPTITENKVKQFQSEIKKHQKKYAKK
jgi:ribosomal protein L40E